MEGVIIIYQNYHSHTFFSNIITPDSATSIEDYAKRAVELGHKTLSSGEHGWQGHYYKVYEVAKKYGLKFIFSTEAYWVLDRFEKDNTNCHIVLIAKNEKGRRAINTVLSEANISGYYYKPRLDLELLFSLPPEDVFVTSACLAFWNYDNVEEIVQKLHNHFKDNFLLEVQYHNTEEQKEINSKILKLSSEYNIDIIMGCDSHYILPEDSKERDNVLEAKGIRYDSEDGWYMDYPSEEEAIKRFQTQGILSEEEIKRAINNTNIILDFDDFEFNKDIKLPTLYPDKSQNEKDKIFVELIVKRWNEVKNEIPKELHKLYQSEIQKEVQVIINTHMSDYFLLDYYIVKKAVENGGVITKSGRGSGVSYYINRLLGFTKVDRISAQVKMYPERFISETRILETKSLPDLDLNLGNPEVFAQAQEELLGIGHSYPMIAFGTFKVKSAFKLYARAKNLPFDIANIVTSQLDKYEVALKYAEDDDKDLIELSDYVDEEYMPLIEESKKYQGIISDKKSHPCAYLIYSGDIKSEIGLIKCKSESTGKETITTVVDGYVAEKYKFLKNDLLKVDVVLNNKKIYDKIGIEPLTVSELLKVTKDNKKVWDIYRYGLTQCVNQCEKSSTTNKVMNYKPVNISELTAFIAGIRPSFKSMYHIFETRESFSYNIKAFDNILRTEELPYSFVLYQEQMMATLQYAGFPSDETYGIIKAIAKKHPEIVIPLKDKFKKGFGERIKQEEPNLTDDEIAKRCSDVWTIIENASNYGFNASHAYCVAIDSLDGAYLKANYPYEFYETMLQIYTDKGNKEKVALLLKEMETAFNIKLGRYKFRLDNRSFTADEKANSIHPCLKSIKYLNQQVSEELFNMRDKEFDTFTDLLIELTENTACDTRKVNILITLGYFEEFGEIKKLLNIYDYFCNRYKKTYVEKTKVKRIAEIKEFELNCKNEKLPFNEAIKADLEYVGYSNKTIKTKDEFYMITDIDTKKTHPIVTLYQLNSSRLTILKVKINDYRNNQFELFDIIKVIKFEESKKWIQIGGKWERSDELETILKVWSKVQ